ncbi:MAG: PAS domain S-box protein [Sphingomonas sp.]|jgi:PAS domain S-box-containing protein|uniref:PAS domain S-box protein n=1 Tax=Sphingomonas sp. TaxID=28214 RepID=UPI00356AF3FF
MNVAPSGRHVALTPALREAERGFALVADAIDDQAIFMVARDGTILSWNSGAQRMTGYAPEDIIGAPYGRLFAPDAEGAEADDILAAAAAHGRYRGENWRARQDGTRFLANFTVHAVSDDDGAVIGFAAITRDVSDRRAAERRLAESERAYRLLADHASDIIARIDLNGVRRYVSPACRAIFGFEPEELVGRAPLAEVHPDDRARVEEGIRALVTADKGTIQRYRQRHRDGHYVWMETSYTLVRDPATGAPVELITVARDISRHRAVELDAAATEARLQEHVRLLQLAERAAQLGHWRYDPSEAQIFWSDQVFRIHGLEPGNVPDLGAALAAYHPDDQAMVSEAFGVALREGTPFSYRARLTRPDGTITHVSSQGQTIRAPDGTVLGLFGTFQDVSEHVATEGRLSAALEEAKVAERAKADFLAKMSHEIRTPMTGVMGMIELLRNEPSAQKREALFASLDRSTRTLMRILDDVLDYSRIQANELAIRRAPFDLRATVEASIDLFRHAARAKGLDLVLDFHGGPARVVGDGERLQQILFNLLGNAIKFTAVGTVSVHVTPPSSGDDWAFAVHDTGLGLPPDADALLFRPFVQGDPTIARRFGGTGLGLAISRTLAEAMGGTLRVASKGGPGSCLELVLPLPVAVDAVDRAACPPIAIPARDILVAEDHPANRLLLDNWLTRQGHRVRCVDDGCAAVAAAAATAFDVILMDRQMPGMDGFAASAAIRALPGAAALTPIILLSADVLSDMSSEMRATGIVERLAKPVDFARLGRCLAALPGSAAAPRAVIDPAPLAALLDQADAPAARRFLAMVEDELSSAPERIIGALRDGDAAIAYDLAHRSIGALANVGATALVAALRQVRRDMTPAETAPTVGAIAAAAAATRRHLAAITRRDGAAG